MHGDSDFDVELAELEKRFAPVASTLEGFATRHRLLLEKYPKQNHAWHFSFRHPAGGTGLIQVLLGPGDLVLVVGARNLLDFDKFRARSFAWNRGTIALSDPALPRVLTSLLREMVELPMERLTPTGVDYRPYWSAEAPNTLRAYEESLPLPIVE
ncbi:MAG TPA: hypothetical protein VFO94_02140 [Gammaproteobacteria bacterium]|nr:hypothetical protein [Gammaproteobacteria bacterium]